MSVSTSIGLNTKIYLPGLPAFSGAPVFASDLMLYYSSAGTNNESVTLNELGKIFENQAPTKAIPVAADTIGYWDSVGLVPSTMTIGNLVTSVGKLGANLYVSAAAAGTTQGTATAITNTSGYINVSSGTGGVVLPATAVNQAVCIENNTSANINVYPPTSSAIDALGTNIPYVLSSGASAIFLGTSGTTIASFSRTIGTTALPGGFSYGTVAAAGIVQGTAASTGSFTYVNITSATAGSATGVILPATVLNKNIALSNTTTIPVFVYPPSGSNINSLAANAAFLLASGGVVQFIGTSATNWISFSTGTPSAASQVVSVYSNTSGQVITSSGAQITNWTLIQDPGSNFNASTGVFTAPRIGNCLINATIAFATGASGSTVIRTYKNGSLYQTAFLNATGVATVDIDAVMALNAGDTIYLFAQSGAAGDTLSTVSNQCQISFLMV